MRGSFPRLVAWLVAGAVAFGVPATALAVDRPIPGKTATSKRDRNTNAAKLTKVIARAPRGGPTFAIPAPFSLNDPRTAGGTFLSFKVGVPGAWTPIGLPAGPKWSGLGNPAGSRGWKYRGDGTFFDPCRSVLVTPTVIKAICKGTGSASPSFTMPVGGASVSHSLTLGFDRYCTLFPPPFSRDDGVRKIWKDKNASAPGGCPNPTPGATPTPPPSTPTPTPSPTPTPTPPPYGSASQAFLAQPGSLLD